MRTRRVSSPCLCLVTGILLISHTSLLRAQDSAQSAEELLEQIIVSDEGSSSRSVQKEAIGQIPLGHLAPRDRAQVRTILNSTDMFRRLPTLTFEVEPRVYKYFMQHPDVAVSIWRALKVSEYQMSRTGPRDFSADGGDGTLGELEVLYHDDNQQVVICNGEFRSPILKRKLRAQAVLHLVATTSKTADGRMFVSHRLDLFVHFPSDTFGAAVKLTKPVSNMIIDRNFREVSLFVQMMSLAMRSRPDWVEGLAGSLEGVQTARKKDLVTLTAHVFVDHQEQLKAQQQRIAAENSSRVASKPDEKTSATR